MTNYIGHLAALVAIFSLAALGLSLMAGHLGCESLGHAGVMAIGAYASALLTRAGVPFPLALVLSGSLCAVFGPGFALLASRLSPDRFVIGTLACQLFITTLLTNLESVTNGNLGIAGIAPASLGPLELTSPWAHAGLAWGLLALAVALCATVVRSPLGRLARAVREDKRLPEGTGRNPLSASMRICTLSCVLTGIAGCLFAHHQRFLDPSTLLWKDSFTLLVMVILGGAHSVWGAIAGPTCLILLPELLRFVDLAPGVAASARQILFACVLILFVALRPRGLFAGHPAEGVAQ
jgi:branched-chain amino acid transport system permease protein